MHLDNLVREDVTANGNNVEFEITDISLAVRNYPNVVSGTKDFMEANINVYFDLYAPNVTNVVTKQTETLICRRDTIVSPAVLGGNLKQYCFPDNGGCSFHYTTLQSALRGGCQCIDFDYTGICNSAVCRSNEISDLLRSSSLWNNAMGLVYWPSRCNDVTMFTRGWDRAQLDIPSKFIFTGAFPCIISFFICILLLETRGICWGRVENDEFVPEHPVLPTNRIARNSNRHTTVFVTSGNQPIPSLTVEMASREHPVSTS